MKFKLLIIIYLGFVMANSVNAQNVPNGGFEDWEMRILWDEPESWTTGNQETFFNGISTVSKTTDSYSGDLAMRMECYVSGEDTVFGYAFSNGRITDGELSDTLRFEGGFPVASAPDSIFGYFKYDLAVNDTAILLVTFKKEGDYVGQNIFYLTGESGSYAKFGWEIAVPSEVPDTALVAVTSSNPNSPQTGGYMQVDSLWFGNLPDAIPNSDFEIWEEESYQEPEHWVSANLFVTLFGGDISATPTVDAKSGSFALRLEAVETMIPEDNGFSSAITGFAMAFGESFNFGEDVPRFSIDFNPTALTGYYKFSPFLNDTALIFVSLVDDQDMVYEAGTILIPTDEYTLFELPVNYPKEVNIVEASVVASTTTYFMEAGEEGSVLFLDDLHLFNPCDTFPTFEIMTITQPSCDDSIAIIDAGAGWDEYLWSTSETTQEISVWLSDVDTVYVTVTDTTTGCQFTDEVELVLPTCIDTCETFAPYEIIITTQATCADSIATLDAGAGYDGYLWSNDANTQVIDVKITETVTYSVTVTDDGAGCSFIDNVELSPPIDCEVDIENQTDKQMAVGIYPNPNSGVFTIEFQNMGYGQYEAEIIDVTGKSLFQVYYSANQQKNKFTVDLSAYPVGLYLLKVSGDNYNQCDRVLIY